MDYLSLSETNRIAFLLELGRRLATGMRDARGFSSETSPWHSQGSLTSRR